MTTKTTKSDKSKAASRPIQADPKQGVRAVVTPNKRAGSMRSIVAKKLAVEKLVTAKRLG